jgi:hypothetical protein
MYRTASDFEFEFQITPLDPLAGDYNRNGVLDAADYVVWRKAMVTGNLVADGTGDGAVTERDYQLWRQHFGATATSGGSGQSAQVPEPSAALLVAMAACIGLNRRRRKNTR